MTKQNQRLKKNRTPIKDELREEVQALADNIASTIDEFFEGQAASFEADRNRYTVAVSALISIVGGMAYRCVMDGHRKKWLTEFSEHATLHVEDLERAELEI